MYIFASLILSDKMKLFLNIGEEVASFLLKGREVLIKLILVNGIIKSPYVVIEYI